MVGLPGGGFVRGPSHQSPRRWSHVQILLGADRGADECSSASSKSCWGEREDNGDEEVEWGALPQAKEGRGQVGQRRVVLAPEESQGTPQSVQDREPPSTTFPASSGVWRLVLVQSQQRENQSRSWAGEPFATETAPDHDDVLRFDISSNTAPGIWRRQGQLQADENVEVPVVEMVPLVRPTEAVLRAAFVGTSGIWRKCSRCEVR